MCSRAAGRSGCSRRGARASCTCARRSSPELEPAVVGWLAMNRAKTSRAWWTTTSRFTRTRVATDQHAAGAGFRGSQCEPRDVLRARVRSAWRSTLRGSFRGSAVGRSEWGQGAAGDAGGSEKASGRARDRAEGSRGGVSGAEGGKISHSLREGAIDCRPTASTRGRRWGGR